MSRGGPRGNRFSGEQFRLRPATLVILLAVVAVLTYWPAIGYDFVNYDDPDYASNWHVMGGLNLANLGWAFGTGFAANWHPLTWFSLMLDVGLFGQGPAGHHLVNLLLHAANTALLFLVLHKLTGAQYCSALVASLFAVHPLHVESVAWISERKDVLSTFFALLALWAYAFYVRVPAIALEPAALEHGPSNSRPRRLRPVYYLLALGFFVCSLMSKAMFVTLPFLLLLLDYWPLRRFSKTDQVDGLDGESGSTGCSVCVWEKVPFLLLSAASCIVTVIVQNKGGAVRNFQTLPLPARFENALVAYASYLAKTVWPVDLSVLYVHPGRWPSMLVLVSASLIVAGCVISLLLSRRIPFLFTGWFWFLGTLVPVIGLVQVGMQSMADRYTYVPLVGIFIAVSWGLAEWHARHPRLLIQGAIITCVFSVLVALVIATRTQLAWWSNGESLFRHAVAVTSNNSTAQAFLDNNLGTGLYREGKVDEAIEHFRNAIRLYPQYPLAWNNLGIALAVKGELNEAIRQYQQALELAPRYAKAFVNLADAMAVEGRLQEAVENYRKALEIEPESVNGWNNLGAALVRQGQYQQAVECYERTLFYAPNSARTYANLGKALALEGHLEESMTNCVKALQLDPANAEAHLQIGELLLKQGKVQQARAELNEALRIRPDYREASEQLRALRSEDIHPAQ